MQSPCTLCRLESCWCLISTSLLGNCLLHSKQANLFQSVSFSSLPSAFRGCSSRGTGGWWGCGCCTCGCSSSSSSSLSLSPPYSPRRPIRGFTTLGYRENRRKGCQLAISKLTSPCGSRCHMGFLPHPTFSLFKSDRKASRWHFSSIGTIGKGDGSQASRLQTALKKRDRYKSVWFSLQCDEKALLDSVYSSSSVMLFGI